jgi:hypothetical protein
MIKDHNHLAVFSSSFSFFSLSLLRKLRFYIKEFSVLIFNFLWKVSNEKKKKIAKIKTSVKI